MDLRLLNKKPRLSTPNARELREVWLFTAGSKPGVVNQDLSRAWSIHRGDEITPDEYEALGSEILHHYRTVKSMDQVKWARLDWTGFDPLPYRNIFIRATAIDDDEEKVG